MKRFGCRFVAALALLASVEGTSAASPQTPPLGGGRTLIIVDGVALPAKVPKAHDRLQDRLQDAFRARGWNVSRFAPIEDCADRLCAMSLASQARADYVLRLQGQQNQDDGYDVTIELVPQAGGALQVTKAYCDYCNIERMGDVVARTASDMLAQAAPAPSPVVVGPRSTIAAVAPAVAPPPRQAVPVRSIRRTEPSSATAWVPWALMGAGALAMGYGGWALYKDGDTTGTCSSGSAPTCERYDATTVGVLSLVGGGLLATAGVVWQVRRMSRPTTVSVTPTSIVLNMRY